MQHERAALKSQVERIRHEIQEYGESIVACEELRVLCVNEVSESGQWNVIAQIAISEDWSFAFFPDGSVRFAKNGETLRFTLADGKTNTATIKAGQAVWRNAETHTVENVGKNEAHALDIELKK